MYDEINPYLTPYLSKLLRQGISVDNALIILDHLKSLRGALTTYLPRQLVTSILGDPRPGQVGGAFRHGTAMFADVSGFTAMSEKLSVLGKEGAEEITSIVNDYFEAMLEISDAYGGDLLKFGGDALLIFFDGVESAFRALSTSTIMQEAMSRFAEVKTSQGVFPLRMSIGIGSGPIFFARLGTPGHMEYAVMGRALTNMAQAEKWASADQIVVDQATRWASEATTSYVPLEDGFFLFFGGLTSSVTPGRSKKGERETQRENKRSGSGGVLEECLAQAAVLKGLSSFVPGELLERLISDPHRPAFHSSHRPVTVMFANFFGIDEIIEALGPEHQEAITDILNLYFVTVCQTLEQYGGTVSRLDAFTLGHRIMALFGALRAHEDDPERAVRAGIEMNRSMLQVNQQTREILTSIPDLREEFGPSPLKQRIGINSGIVFAGNMGSKIRREYTVMGSQVNLTARLMNVAREGEVLIGHSTARRIEQVFNLEEKDPVKVKGISQPVRNYSAQGIIDHSRRWESLSAGPVIGRDEEIKLGRKAVDCAVGGEATVLVIKGVSGIGKTRLAEEVALMGVEKGMDLLAGSCLAYGKTMTYHPWAELLRSHFGLRLADESQRRPDRIEAVKRGMEVIGEPDWTPVIGALLGLEIPDNDLTRELDAKLRRQRIFDLTVKLLLARAQEKPLILMIEDAHWADPASMELISYVSRNIAGHPVLFMIAHRPDKGLPDWTTFAHAINLVLEDLSPQACLEIVRSMIGEVPLPKTMLQIIQTRGCGNPFFIREVVRALIDAEALQQDTTGSWRVSREIDAVEIPETIHGIIISRVDRLLDLDRRILQVASVVGRIFTFQTLYGVHAYSDPQEIIRERLNYLEGIGITELQDIKTELYRFLHLTTRDVIYESLSFEVRRGLHCQIGAFIEQAFADALGEQTDLLAYHYFEGQAWPKAFEFNLLAARHAQEKFANDSAITSYQRTLEAAEKLAPDEKVLSKRLEAHESLGEVLTLVGKYDEALEQFASARDLVKSALPLQDRFGRLADLCRHTAAVYERRSEYNSAYEWLQVGLSFIEEAEPNIEAALIYLLGAGLYYRQGQAAEAIRWCQRSLDMAARLATREAQQAIARTNYLLGTVYTRLGDLTKAVDHCQRSISIYQEIDDFPGLARAYNNLANAYVDQGDWDHASESYQKSLDTTRQVGDIQQQGIIVNNLGLINLDRGEWGQAKTLFEQSNAIWRQLGASLPEAVTLSNLAQVYLYQGELARAHHRLSESQTLFEAVGSEYFLPELERRWGEYYWKSGDVDQALKRAWRSLEMAEAQEVLLEEGLSARLLGQIYLSHKEFRRAEESLTRSLSVFKKMDNDFETARTVLALTELAIASGRLEAPQVHLARAIETLRRMGAQPDLDKAQALKDILEESG
jgi:class 3 adenylate cyclase/tetratricopeptide (TPR) repeat protein